MKAGGACWPVWLARAPSLVAESLAVVAHPLAAWLRPGPSAPAAAVAARLARALLPPEADTTPPAWLRADQRLSVRRALEAVRRYGGALLADGVGTGKTFIALAVASALEPDRSIHVIVPATLRSQWAEAAQRIGMPVRVHTHETLSRGRAPAGTAGPVIIDESHRFRTASARRYRTLAPWCVGRRGILLSATPVVNRLEDLSNQLALLVRDDALAWAGIPSLRTLPDARESGAVAELVITGEDRSSLLPARRELRFRPEGSSSLSRLISGLGSLALSTDPPTAELLRIVLLRAVASSPAAAMATLGRYGMMLRHAKDAGEAGRRLSRETIRRFVGADAEQLVLWHLVAEPLAPVELVVDDLERVAGLERIALEACEGPDPKAALLEDIVRDETPTLVFTSAMATVAYLQRRLGRGDAAWCTGKGAGLGRGKAPRDAVLDWFRRRSLPTDGLVRRPRLLLATDVAAEGLDLPLVERVVHYDLPWTSVRLDQRSGRALRLGSRHASVAVVRLDPPEELAAVLRQESILQAKAGLPFRIGLDEGPEAPWRLRARIAASWAGMESREGTAVVRGDERATVAGLRIDFADGTARELVFARTAKGWTPDLATIARVLRLARSGAPLESHLIRGSLRAPLHGLSRRMAAVLRQTNGAALGVIPRGSAVRSLQRRLLALAAGAARRRHREDLERVEAGLRHLRRGLTAGEEGRIEDWMRLTDSKLFRALLELPREPPIPAPSAITLTALLQVEPCFPDG